MLALSLVKEIERSLQVGTESQRKIAARLGVGRGTVAAIASGRRGIYGHEPEGDYGPFAHLTPPERCPICGYLVYMPCLVCRTREHRHWQTVWQGSHIALLPNAERPLQRQKRTRRRHHRNRTLQRSRVA